MAQVYTFGYVMNDVVPKTSQKNTTYVCFTLKEQLRKGRSQTFQVWAWGDLVTQLTKSGICKGSMIWISGTLELVDFTVNHGQNRTKDMKVYLSSFGHVLGRNSKRTAEANKYKAINDAHPSVEELDGDRMPLPE